MGPGLFDNNDTFDLLGALEGQEARGHAQARLLHCLKAQLGLHVPLEHIDRDILGLATQLAEKS
jgi:hypothetical protein